ncbi:MAG: hypothetical protein A3J75_06325 [Acidobacteria bacterium RBG_16_68_9]|nr:MAG: hypothetical protein A3J75_06325 [Acidobacteria bacterium RBG_16_68_9]
MLAVENLFSTRQFPSHTVTAEEEAAGFEVAKLANGRRSALDYWTSTTANSDTWAKVACDQMRAANFIALDRGHNLAGYTVQLHVSSDDFSTWETAFSVAIPTGTAPGALDDYLGVRTEEGAWLKRFDLRAGKAWRLYVPAMGASLKPQVVGLWVGLSWQPSRGLSLPVSPTGGDFVTQLLESAMGWQGRGRGTGRRAGTLLYKYVSELEVELGEYHVEGHFGAGRPLWLIHDARRGDKARLVVRTPERLGGAYAEDWANKPSLSIGYVEHEPRAA